MIAFRARPRARVRLVAAIVVVIGGLSLAACGAGAEQPARLVDGSVEPPLPRALRDLADGAVVSEVRVRQPSELDVRGRACLDSFRAEFLISPATVVVQRVGAIGATLTFSAVERRVVLGCDRTSLAVPNGPWCARSVGRLFSGRLRDARVDILCRGARGDPVGFGWVEPGRGVRWVVVDQGASKEVEEVAGELPVRIATADVDQATSSATFDVRELDSDGKEVRRYRLRGSVAG